MSEEESEQNIEIDRLDLRFGFDKNDGTFTLLNNTIVPLHKVEIPVHQWIAKEAYDYFVSQIEGADIGSYLGTISGSHGDNRNTLLEGTAAEDKSCRPPLYQCWPDMPYFRHFCAGADGGEIRNGYLAFSSALTQAENIWTHATSAYSSNKALSFYYLGHIAHLVADMTVPAHTHNDPHVQILGDGDTYEETMAYDDNFKLWRYGSGRSSNWWNHDLTLFSDPYSLFYRTANYTEDYDSDDYDGDAPPYYNPDDYADTWHHPENVSRSGGMDIGEITVIGDDLMPYAMRRVADLYRLFYKEVDTSDPSCTMTYPTSEDVDNPNYRTSTSAFNLTATGSDAQSGIIKRSYRFWYGYWTGSTWTDWTEVLPSPTVSSVSFDPPYNNKLYHFCVAVTNGAGNSTFSNFKYLFVDATNPSTPSITGYSDSGHSTTLVSGNQYPYPEPHFHFTASDSGSGIKGYYYYWGTNSNADPSTWNTSGHYTASGLTSGNDYYFRVKAKDKAGNIGAISTFAYKYRICSPPSITAHPSPSALTICSGQSHQYCVSATGTTPLSYQWQRNSSNIPGATSSCYTATQSGSYRCIVSNSCGSATSNSATLTVISAPVIMQHPSPPSLTISEGESHQYCVSASGSGLSYQWQKDGANIPGATSSCYTATQSGSYRCVASNSCGSATSDPATLTVKPIKCTITATAGSNGTIDPCGIFDVNYGDDQLFTAIPDPCYTVDQWYLDGNPVQSGNTTYTLYDIQSEHTVHVTFKTISGIIYVDDDATTGANNGTSWASAYINLQDAFAFTANSGDDVNEIRVAQGIYKPDLGTDIMLGDREATFQLVNGVTIKGGYAGFGAPDPNTRDIKAYETILSGDLNGDDGPDFSNNEENSYHVVTGSGTDATAIFDGFTITSGNSDDSSPTPGASGMYNDSGSPTVANCTFIANLANYGETRYLGGGMENHYSSPTVTNCTFAENVADYGGGMFNYNSNPTVTKCVFMGNQVKKDGGGMLNYFSSPILTNCTFRGNHARNSGGMENRSSSPEVTNCTFEENTAIYYGGGMTNWSNFGECAPVLTGCTFSRNSAGAGGGGIHNGSNSSLTVQNCILWSDSPDEIFDSLSTVCTVTYSDVQGGWLVGEGNINLDPCFADPCNGDYHLLFNSPCIDTGDSNSVPSGVITDLDGNPRIGYGFVDMGAYERHNRVYNRTQDTSYETLQDALAAASSGEEIFVAEGTYKPDQGAGITSSDRTATFQLKNGVAIHGGFSPMGDNWGEADPNAHETVLSGDLNNNDAEVSDPATLLTESTRADNSYHVVTSSGTNSLTILNGFTITGGNADGDWPDYYGGGILNEGGSPTLNNCKITKNAAQRSGGMHNWSSSSPTLTNCVFSQNFASHAGGAMDNRSTSNPTLVECKFMKNVTGEYAGAICNYYNSDPLIIRCVFVNNGTATGGFLMKGGAMFNQSSSPTFINCLLVGNLADNGGGIYNRYESNPTIINCTITGNSATHKGGAVFSSGSNPTIINSIVWDNIALDGPEFSLESNWKNDPSHLTVAFSNVMGGQGAVYIEDDLLCSVDWNANLEVDPCFTDPNNGDYHLLPVSPCIDAADNNAVPTEITNDLDGHPRFLDDLCTIDSGNGTPPIVDMGAYEFAYTYFGDLDGDCVLDVDLVDFAILGDHWKDEPCNDSNNWCGGADVNKNGKVDFSDVKVIFDHWLEGKR